MTATPLHLLRHGAPETPGLLLGRTDASSTVAGVEACLMQAKNVAFERIVTSDLVRASRAAEAIGLRSGGDVHVDPRWREMDFGIWDGLAPAAVDPQALACFWQDPDRHAPPGGEGWSALLARVAAALDDLPPVPTLVVTHGGAMRAALAHLCGFSLQQGWAVALPYASLLSFERWTGDAPSAQIIGLRA